MVSKLFSLIGVVGTIGIFLLGGCVESSRERDSQVIANDLTGEGLGEINAQNQHALDLIEFDGQDKDEIAYFTEEEFFAQQYEAWLDRNPDFVGWISISQFSISEPVVRGQDNEEYLRVDLDGNYRKAGTVFMDYRNIGNDFDPHMIIYGHNLKDDQMFGPLRQYLDATVDDAPLIEYESLYGREQYQVFSVYRIQADDYQYQLTNEEGYLQDLIERSQINFVMKPQAGVKMLTLSTCSYEENNERLVIHAYRLEEKNE